MQAPRASAWSNMAAPTITQPARDASSCWRYFGLLRKLRCAGPAVSSGARPSIRSAGSPWSSPPRASTMEPRRSATPPPSFHVVERADDLVGDVVLGVDVHRFLDDQVVLFGFGDLLDDAVRAVE